MLLFIILFFVALALWIISIIFNDIEDGLQYYYKESIFDWIPKDSWWSKYMKDPDDTWKRKYVWLPAGRDGDVNIGRKKWLGIIIPAFLLDGWHGAKIIRQGFQYMTYFVGILGGYVLAADLSVTLQIWSWLFFIGMILFGVTNFLTHEIYVFKGVLRKEWWIKRGKEEKIKKLLDKL